MIRVLVVEDHEDDAELMILELQAAGLETAWTRVETADDFRAHLAPDVDIILSDYNLPHLKAPEVLKLLAESGYDTPLIVVTGSISEEIAVATIKQGATDYLLKDRLSRLGEAVRHAIKERDLRRAQREAERNLIVMGRAIETSSNAVAMANLSGEISYINRAFLDMWGLYDASEIVGTRFVELWGSQEENSHLFENLSAGKSSQGQFTLLRANKSPQTLQFSASGVLDKDGIPICVMATFIDVTEQKEAEQARHEADLLRIELENERELNRVRSNFVSMLVHDFRNPLTVIQTSLGLISKHWDRLSLAERDEQISRVTRQAKRLSGLIDDVLMVGQLESRSNQFDLVQVDLNGYCKEIFTEFVQGVDQNNLRLNYTADEVELYASVDKKEFRRALFNLLSNACKYSLSGGMVELRLAAQDDVIEISVSDEGIGIPSEDHKYLFNGFHRGSNVGNIKGTGLGLAIVKQVVEAHHGKIDFQSELHKGTVFTITLPRENK
jgi:PAS domain S-box-containing protein